jgi:hypothetical protein
LLQVYYSDFYSRKVVFFASTSKSVHC